MTRPTIPSPYTCARCLRARSISGAPKPYHRSVISSGARPLSQSHVRPAEDTARTNADTGKEEGAMSRRLSDMTQQNLEEGGRGAQKAVEEAGFDEELKTRLLERITEASFRSENAAAFAQAGLISAAGKATRDIAAAEPWTGTESVEDASLRMLNDARKPMRGPARVPVPRGLPIKIETGKTKKLPTGARLASARDRTSMYAYLKDDSVSDNQREAMRKELKERFTAGARPMPTTLQGLASLANERIEDAIARGQFKNLPRGKKLERDYNMSSPFIETTSYFLNKIIQKQEIVPPWIEKQQELTSTASKFRIRLRAEWRRHAARLIGSQGGSLESQVLRAEQYAAAEAIVNPSKKKEEIMNAVDGGGEVSKITLTADPAPTPTGSTEAPSETITIQETSLGATTTTTVQDLQTSPSPTSISMSSDPILPNPYINNGTIQTFRDPTWQSTENAYHTLAITSLNNLTRSYNLMAPNLAKKPYFSLDRELRSCFADVAPLLAQEIRDRASRPRVVVTENVGAAQKGGVLERLGGEPARVWDETRPQYGFKQFWKDMFGKEK